MIKCDAREKNKIYGRVKKSLLKLLACRSLDEITVGNVAEEAGISRQYFYRYYLDKIDLVYDIFLGDVEDALAETFQQENVPDIFMQLQTNTVFYQKVLQSSFCKEFCRFTVLTGEYFIETLYELSCKKMTVSEEQAAEVYVHGVSSLFFDNLLHKKYEAETVAEICQKNAPPALGAGLCERFAADRVLHGVIKKLTKLFRQSE